MTSAFRFPSFPERGIVADCCSSHNLHRLLWRPTCALTRLLKFAFVFSIDFRDGRYVEPSIVVYRIYLRKPIRDAALLSLFPSRVRFSCSCYGQHEHRMIPVSKLRCCLDTSGWSPPIHITLNLTWTDVIFALVRMSRGNYSMGFTSNYSAGFIQNWSGGVIIHK